LEKEGFTIPESESVKETTKQPERLIEEGIPEGIERPVVKIRKLSGVKDKWIVVDAGGQADDVIYSSEREAQKARDLYEAEFIKARGNYQQIAQTRILLW